MHDRETTWNLVEQQCFDVLILGGGINGSCLFDRLSRQGYKVLLVDKGDIGSGTSQASGMMVWGGLLYLRSLDLPTVIRLSRDRDAMIGALGGRVARRIYRYIPSERGDLHPKLVQAALYFYWMLGLFRRKVPRCQASFEEERLLRPGAHVGSLLYEEGVLSTSDCRFTFDWLALSPTGQSLVLNYCTLAGEYARAERRWRLELADALRGRQTSVRASLIVNCAGVWTDEVNRAFGIDTPFRHALSKGVYVGISRLEGHQSLMIFEMGEHADVITLVPWGPVSLWGPTESFPRDVPDGQIATEHDIRFLLDRAREHFKQPFDKSRIVSLRCGMRPLAIKKDLPPARYPLDLSRRQHVVADDDLPWVSSYGGKITGCREMARKLGDVVSRKVRPSPPCADLSPAVASRSTEWISWPGIAERVPSPAWCARQELCCTLEDYLRRRTNIAQWVPREGLGRQGEHREALIQAAQDISGGTREAAEAAVRQYESAVKERFDRVLERV